MKLSIDPAVAAPCDPTAESSGLSRWYDAQPAVRRLWGIKEAHRLRVIVAVEPTHDGDDIYPVWLANIKAWADELHFHTGGPVQLELMRELPGDGIEVEAGSIVIAHLFWRDPSVDEALDVWLQSVDKHLT